MQDQDPIVPTKHLDATVDASAIARATSSIEVLSLLVRPHGLEPGKTLSLDAAHRLLAPPSVTDLLYEMKAARRQSDQLERATLAYLGLTALTTYGFLYSNVTDVDRRFCGLLFIGSLSVATVNAAARFIKVGSAQAAIARLMSRHHDLRVVGPLVDAFRMPDPETRQLASLALRYLLPRLNADDTDLLNEAQRNLLYRYLRGHDTELALAILKALEQIGDAKAVPPVQRLTEKGIRTDPRLRKAAEECLPYLLLRVERAAAPHILLRASSNAATDTASLLRTVTTSHHVDASVLLRPPD